MYRISYFFRRALAHIRRNPGVAGVTVGTVAVVFLILGILALVGHNLEGLSRRLGAGLKLTVFLLDDCEQEQLLAIRKLLEDSPATQQVRFVGRQEALARFRLRLGQQADLLGELDHNPLPASLEATFAPGGQNPAIIRALARRVEGLPGVEEVQYGRDWLERFFRFVGAARMGGLIAGALIFLAALLIISNTIRLSVFARREEIHILQLVGATDGFIKAPFYLEGVLLGLAGATLGMALTWLAFSLVVPELFAPDWLWESRFAVAFLPVDLLIGMVGAGAFLGLLGTMSSLWRHLKI